MQYPVRSRWQAIGYANRLLNSKKHHIRVDGSDCWGTPAVGIHIRNQFGEEILTLDSFRELWLRNVECDERFITKPFLARQA